MKSKINGCPGESPYSNISCGDSPIKHKLIQNKKQTAHDTLSEFYLCDKHLNEYSQLFFYHVEPLLNGEIYQLTKQKNSEKIQS